VSRLIYILEESAESSGNTLASDDEIAPLQTFNNKGGSKHLSASLCEKIYFFGALEAEAGADAVAGAVAEADTE